MSAPTGPDWYPSKQFSHAPPAPAGAPTHGVTPEPTARTEAPAERGTMRRLVDKLLRRT